MEISELIKKIEQTESQENKESIFSLSKELFNQASREINHEGMMVSNYYHAFYYFQFMRNFTKAMQYAKSAINEALEVSNDIYLMRSYDILAATEIEMEKYYEAIMDLLEGLAIAKKLNDISMMSMIHSHIGDVFFYLGDASYALEYYQRAKDGINNMDGVNLIIYKKCMYNFLFTSIYISKYDSLNTTFNMVMMSNIEHKEIFVTLKNIAELYKRTNYSTNLIDDIYKLMLSIDEIEDVYIKMGQFMLLDRLIEYSADYNLTEEYVDLLISYATNMNSNAVTLNVYNIKERLLPEEEDAYGRILNIKNNKLLLSLSSSLKKILDLNMVKSEMDYEIKKNQELMQLSSTDYLTKLYNRRYSENEINQIINDRTKASYAFIIIDVDKFKDINDTYGHAIGDKALIFVADSLKKYFEGDSIISRLGGDEFIVLLYNLSSEYEIRKNVLSYKLSLLENYMKETKHEMLGGRNITISIGATLEGEDFNKLYANADTALYNSKYSGRGTYSLYPLKNTKEDN